MYSLPEKSFLLASDEKGKIYLAKINKIKTQNIDNKKKDFDAYYNKIHERVKKYEPNNAIFVNDNDLLIFYKIIIKKL